jgi:HK97 family phage prohead protease
MTRQHWPLTIERRSAGDEASITASTGRLDYMRDRITQATLNFDTWLAGTAAVLWGHDLHQLPVAKGLRAVLTGDAHRLHFRWLDDDAAQRVRTAFEAGVLGASIGFIADARTPNEYGGYDITRATVVEVSLTPVPANADCTRVLKTLGLAAGRSASAGARRRLTDPDFKREFFLLVLDVAREAARRRVRYLQGRVD